MSLPPPTRQTTPAQVPVNTISSIPITNPSGGGRASVLPVALAAISIAIGAIPVFLSENILFEVLGYFFAGFIPIMCLGWDAVAQRRGMADPNFIPSRMFSRVLKFLAASGVIIAVINIINIAKPIAEWMSEQ